MRRTSIRVRLMLLMICLTTIPVITLTWIAALNTRASVEKEIISANHSRMKWSDQSLTELIKQIDILFYTLQINEPLINGLTDFNNREVLDALTTVFFTHSRKVNDLTLYMHANQRAVSVNFKSRGTFYSLDIRNGPWSRMLKRPISMYFKQSGNGIYAYHSINRFEDRSLLGGISVRIDQDVWNEISESLKSESESAIYLMNDEGELLSGSSDEELSDEIKSKLTELNRGSEDLIEGKTKDHFYFIQKVDRGQLRIVKTIPVLAVNQSANQTIKAGLWIGISFAVASILLSILVSLRISRPIVSLAKTMRNTQIHTYQSKEVYSRDEIGLLESGYNFMMKRIKDLIEEEYQREIEVKNAQLLTLQAQINPHFLNNTLHMIGGMALAKNAPEIYQITRVIGDLLRYSISDEGDMVTLDNELKHMRNYLFIQERRFEGRCSVDIQADDSVLSTRLPKFSLQPIVENAFEHGLQRKEGAWKLRLRISQMSNRIAIFVKDEGLGIAAERLRELRLDLKRDFKVSSSSPQDIGPRKRRGIGIRNVDARMKLQFGSKYGVRIFSRQGEGTLVAVSIPVHEGGGDRDE